jgi:hypothetical protein
MVEIAGLTPDTANGAQLMTHEAISVENVIDAPRPISSPIP